MAATALIERYAPNLHGVLSCHDRLIVTGTLPGACYAGGMTSFLDPRGIRLFDYPKFAEPLRDRIRDRAQVVCAANGVSIEHVNKSHIRKEDLVARVLAVRGDAPGLVHVCSRQWRVAPVTSRGWTRATATPSCARTQASACTTASTSQKRRFVRRPRCSRGLRQPAEAGDRPAFGRAKSAGSEQRDGCGQIGLVLRLRWAWSRRERS